MRAYNRAYRQMLRGGKPPMSYHMRGKLGAVARLKTLRRREREAREGKGKKVTKSTPPLAGVS